MARAYALAHNFAKACGCKAVIAIVSQISIYLPVQNHDFRSKLDTAPESERTREKNHMYKPLSSSQLIQHFQSAWVDEAHRDT